MNYTFLDAAASVQTAQASVVSGAVLRPAIDIASVLSAVPTTFSGSPSISGAVTIVGTPSISGAITVVGTPSISGSVGLSGTPSISGAVTVIGNPSVSGTVGASIIGQLPSGTAVIGSVAVLQGTSPWAISGSVSAFLQGNASVITAIQGSVAATLIGTNPVIVTGSVLTLQAPTASLISGVTSIITGTGVVSVLSAAPGGQRNYITQVLVTNQAASAAGIGTQVNIIDDGSGNVLYAGYAASQGGGFSLSFPTPLRQPTSTFSLSAKSVTQASVVVSASGYTAS